MDVANIRSRRQFLSYDWRPWKIITYGETNDFPQTIDEILTASKTGNACLDIYNDFVYGSGFVDSTVGNIIVNGKNQTLNTFRRLLTKDLTKYAGVAIHVNYNMNYRVKSMTVIPFEYTRLGSPNEDGEITEICVHDDWGRRDQTKTRWSPSDIERYPVWNPDPDVIEAQVAAAGSWEEYKGQVYWFSATHEGELAYPLPKYIAEMTDMRTEEGLSNITGRNVCSNFMLAGILVDIMDSDQNEKQIQEKQMELMKFQGDENALQLWYTTAKNKDEVPVFVPFQGNNYDKAFTATQASVPDNIGQAFKQPPILRAKDVAGNIGADLMTNAYRYYNTVTTRERRIEEEILETLFEYWWVELDSPDFSIQPLVFNSGEVINDRIGKDAMTQVLGVMTDDKLTLTQKRNTLILGFGITHDEVIKLLPNTRVEGGTNSSALIQTIGVGGLQALMAMLADPVMTDDAKISALVILFGLSEADAQQLVSSEVQIDPGELEETETTNKKKNDTEARGRKKSPTNSGESKRPARLETYLKEAESLRLVDALGARLYQWLDTTDFSGAGPFTYTHKDGSTATITKEQHTELMDGGYFPGASCCKEGHSVGVRTAIAYIAYSRFIMNNPLNATAFGVRYKEGEFSTKVEDVVLVRNSNEARKIGEAYLAEVVNHCKSLGLITCREYVEAPRQIIRVGRKKL